MQKPSHQQKPLQWISSVAMKRYRLILRLRYDFTLRFSCWHFNVNVLAFVMCMILSISSEFKRMYGLQLNSIGSLKWQPGCEVCARPLFRILIFPMRSIVMLLNIFNGGNLVNINTIRILPPPTLWHIFLYTTASAVAKCMHFFLSQIE